MGVIQDLQDRLANLLNERAFHDDTDPECRSLDVIDTEIYKTAESMAQSGGGLIGAIARIEEQQVVAQASKKHYADIAAKFRMRESAYEGTVSWLKNQVLLPLVKRLGAIDKNHKKYLEDEAGRKFRVVMNPWRMELKNGIEPNEVPEEFTSTVVTLDTDAVMTRFKQCVDKDGNVLDEAGLIELKKHFNFSRTERCQLY